MSEPKTLYRLNKLDDHELWTLLQTLRDKLGEAARAITVGELINRLLDERARRLK
jgi:hypothetical protein